MKPQVEWLEPRRLLSDTWHTVDDYLYGTRSALGQAITVDATGKVYAAGTARLGTIGSPVAESHEVVRTSADGGNTWSVLSDYVVQDVRGTTVADIEVDAAGNIYLAGSYRPAGSDGEYWFVRRSRDSGRTWGTVDTVGLGGANTVQGLTIDAAGNIYAVGEAEGAVASSSNSRNWLVRRSTDGGNTWATVDAFVPTDGPSDFSVARGVFVHPTAGVFVAGTASLPPGEGDVGVNAWIVRQSPDGGAGTWVTVDSYKPTEYGADASSLGADAAGNLYAVGEAIDSAGFRHWVVRKSTDGGTAWTTVDDYQLSPLAFSDAQDFVTDSAGNLYVAGSGLDVGTAHWIVRSSAGGTAAWTTVDDFQIVAGADAEPSAIAADPAGRVFVVGTASATSGPTHWITRRLGTGVPTAAVVARHVFYNRSRFDGNDAAANAGDDAAIPPDKNALLAGQDRLPGFDNVTSYDKGINGIIVDIAGLPAGASLGIDDFDFGTALRPVSVTVRYGAGAGGSDRVTLLWTDYSPGIEVATRATANGWLTVTVKANTNTGLAAPDVFSFGNLIGETGDGNGSTGWRVNALDLTAARRALNTPAALDTPTDFNRDGRTNALDLAVVKRNMNLSLSGLPPRTADSRQTRSDWLSGLLG